MAHPLHITLDFPLTNNYRSFVDFSPICMLVFSFSSVHVHTYLHIYIYIYIYKGSSIEDARTLKRNKTTAIFNFNEIFYSMKSILDTIKYGM